MPRIRFRAYLRSAILLWTVLIVTSCKPDYQGDGKLTVNRGLLLTPIYKIQMPGVDISKEQFVRYDLSTAPASEAFYSITLTIPSSKEITRDDRGAWGTCEFALVKNNQEVQRIALKFSELLNCFSRRDGVLLNALYSEGFSFVNDNAGDHYELIFECSGFESSAPILGYIILQSGGI